ncbi:saccharopine dehydrogenase family protein [[Limnothrix rosea] IAM M-220]|uniref:saccharopine dehydrogenase family protein n=1 Tax=[Limnothrix rosea] IAM M-220 TaxID=454133 RepID=UPI00096918A6|nr:saccharopine dehydrogenase NADP-binding domain-containing protein [[Limnothrix rosea] IAM M-220]OKH18716.1 saccharopine dehydrogenase [[Limnothrix rosea] IAM M-220]
MSQSFDLILVGATGFVGQIVCRYLVTHSKTEDFKWAIAGRSLSKLNTLKSSLGEAAQDLKTLQIDVTDEQQVRELCQQTKVIVTTVGPYALYGETLVKVCAETGTDYCDLTGEVQWVQQMIAKYEAIAQQSGARIVHCCGFDSIPSDLGVFYLQQQAQEKFGETCVRVKMRVKAASGGFSGGTAASGVNLVQEAIADPEVKSALANPYILCGDAAASLKHPAPFSPVQIDNTFGEWITPFVMAGVNMPVVLRSNALQDWDYSKKFQYDEAMLVGTGISGWLTSYGLKFALDIFGVAAAIAPELLKKFIPAPGEGPSETEQENGFYDLRFWGETTSGKTIMTKVTGDRDPGYGSTAKILAQAGLCLAKDIDANGGFWTPASIFGETLICRLIQSAGLTFEEID